MLNRRQKRLSERITPNSTWFPTTTLHVYITCVTLALACNYVLGKDMAWDTLNYHLYLGFSALNNRFTQDYFAA